MRGLNMWQSEIVFCREKGYIGFKLPASCMTNHDGLRQEMKTWYFNLGQCRKMPRQTVTNCDKGQRLCPQICWNLPEANRKINSRKCARKSRLDREYSIVGRSDRAHNASNKAYIGSSGNAPACLLKFFFIWWGGKKCEERGAALL